MRREGGHEVGEEGRRRQARERKRALREGGGGHGYTMRFKKR